VRENIIVTSVELIEGGVFKLELLNKDTNEKLYVKSENLFSLVQKALENKNKEFLEFNQVLV
jgi:hypothetical protein